MILLPVRSGIHSTVEELSYFLMFDKGFLQNCEEISTGVRVKASLQFRS